MRKLLYLLILVCSLQGNRLSGQIEIFNWQGYAIGTDASGGANCPMGAMPDVILINSTYYMYYVALYGNVNAIYYATSPDMITWTVQDTVMTASADTNNRIYDIGGPGVIRLSMGGYRLFYRTAQKATAPNQPLFHVRSMVSPDGIHFTHEPGVRIENSTYQPNSYFKSASHPAIYRDSNGNFKAVLTGRDTSMNLNSPAGLYTASSNDEGLTWTNFQPLYAGCHDPVVVRDSMHVYHMYSSNMATGHREVTSADGITWPAVPDSMLIQKNNVPLNEMTSAEIIADLGAVVGPSGNIILYSNFKPQGPGAWVDIAYYFHDPTSSIHSQLNQDQITVYPNPCTEFISLQNISDKTQMQYEIYSVSGELVNSGWLNSSRRIPVSDLSEGVYLLRLVSATDQTVITRVFVKQAN